jgi:hypothetical protein
VLQSHVFKQDAHEMMMLMLMPCYDHAQMMPKCKANTWGVTVLLNSSPPEPTNDGIDFFHEGLREKIMDM